MAVSGQEVTVPLLLRITSITSITSMLKSLGEIGQVKWSLFFLGGFGARTGGFKLPHGNGSFMPRNEGCVLGELKIAGLTSFAVFSSARAALLWICHSSKACLSPWTGCDNKKERDMVRENEGQRNASDRLKV